jgi:glycerophosphoryl diester phosphodiesterase
MRALALAGALTFAFTAHAFELQGHRGARGLAPENTLPSFERAIALGVTTLELDIAITSDGVLVIHHDPTLNPATTRDASGQFLERRGPPIHSLSWAQLQTYDVGRLNPRSDYARNYPDQQPIDGTRIPRLSDLFDLVKRLGDDKIRFAIETKVRPTHPDETPAPEPFARAVVEEIRKAGMAARSQILSFDWRTLQVVQKIAPEIPTVYLTAQQRWLDNIGVDLPTGSTWTAGFQYRDLGSVPKMVKAAGGAYWSVHFGDLDPQKVKEAQSLGVKVLVWTVNDPPLMSRMLDWGVDGLITDRPDLARNVLESRGIRWR